MNKLFSILLLLCVCVSGRADFLVGKYLYSVLEDGQTVSVSNGAGDELTGDIVVPSTVDYHGKTYTVTEVKGSGFSGANITSVTLPQTLKKIGSNAFMFSSTLESASLGGATELGERCFVYCSNLKSVTMSDGVEVLPNNIFESCGKLEVVTMSKSLKAIGEAAFRDCPCLRDIELPSGLMEIGEKAFYGCKSLVSIAIPEGVKSIEANTFRDCTGLSEITIPSTVESIGKMAFSQCAVSTFTIPKSVTSNATGMGLADCPNLKAISVADGNPKYYAQDGVLFCKNDTLVAYPGGASATYAVPSTVKAIAGDAFYNHPTLSSVTLPEGLEFVDNWAFGECQLTGVTIPSTLKTLCVSVFSGSKLKSVVVPPTVETIAVNAFYNCRDLTDLTISDGVKRIGQDAFGKCGMTAVDIPASVNLIVEEAFRETPVERFTVDAANSQYSSDGGVLYSKDKKTLCAFPIARAGEYTVPSGVEKVMAGAFYGSRLTKVELSEGVKEVGANGFNSSEQLSTVILPSTLEWLGDYAFAFSYNIKDVYAKMQNPFDLESAVFTCNATLHVPAGTKSAYEMAAAWSKFDKIEEIDYAGISNTAAAGAPSEVARYNVSGQRVNSSDKGFVLMKMSDGTVRKVIL